MSLSSMASGDTIEVYTEASSDWTDTETVSLSATVDGCLQILSASESREYGGDGQRRLGQAMFASNPSITEGTIVKHTARSDGSPVVPRWFRVIGTYEEGRPGRTLLWYVIAEQLTDAGVPDVV